MVTLSIGGPLDIALVIFLFIVLVKYTDMEKRNPWSLTLMSLGAFLYLITSLFTSLNIWTLLGTTLKTDMFGTLTQWVGGIMEIGAFAAASIGLILFVASPFMNKKLAPKSKPQPTEYKTSLIPKKGEIADDAFKDM
ncbi:hypothetical protein K8R43_00465 [archaeon]|nr:hypothetical protein [archaeon]